MIIYLFFSIQMFSIEQLKQILIVMNFFKIRFHQEFEIIF